MVFTRTRGRFSRCILGRCGFPLLLFLSALLAPSAAAGEEGGWKPYFEDTFARTSPGPDWLAIEEDGRGLRLDGKSACLTFSHSTRYPYRESLPQRCATLLPLHERGQATCPGDAKEHRASGREQQGPRLHSAIVWSSPVTPATASFLAFLHELVSRRIGWPYSTNRAPPL
jgi:hypothetical protein